MELWLVGALKKNPRSLVITSRDLWKTLSLFLLPALNYPSSFISELFFVSFLPSFFPTSFSSNPVLPLSLLTFEFPLHLSNNVPCSSVLLNWLLSFSPLYFSSLKLRPLFCIPIFLDNPPFFFLLSTPRQSPLIYGSLFHRRQSTFFPLPFSPLHFSPPAARPKAFPGICSTVDQAEAPGPYHGQVPLLEQLPPPSSVATEAIGAATAGSLFYF